jgi:hypothetical protein
MTRASNIIHSLFKISCISCAECRRNAGGSGRLKYRRSFKFNYSVRNSAKMLRIAVCGNGHCRAATQTVETSEEMESDLH